MSKRRIIAKQGYIAYKDFNYTNILLAANVTDYNQTSLNYIEVHQVTPDIHEYNRIH